MKNRYSRLYGVQFGKEFGRKLCSSERALSFLSFFFFFGGGGGGGGRNRVHVKLAPMDEQDSSKTNVSIFLSILRRL